MPWSKALRDAGPRETNVVLAFVAGGVVDTLLVLGTGASLPFVGYVVPLLISTLLVAAADRDGPLIRSAMAFVGVEQRKRATSGSRLPVTPSAADRWLEVDHPNASALERASVLLTAGRLADARAATDAFLPASAIDRVRQLRMRASVEAAMSPTADLDIEAIRTAAAELSPDERRYHLVSASWTQAWLSITRGRPWRDELLKVAREFAPYELPLRVRIWLGVQQYAAPVACLLAATGILAIQALL